jgi:hypothetical protein
MIYVYRRAASLSARVLAVEVNGVRLRHFRARRFLRDRSPKVVMWGEGVPPHITLQCPVLNNAPIRTKLTDALLLTKAGIPTIKTSKTNPGDGWLGRLDSHAGGNDLLTPPEEPDFYVRKEAFRREFRIHSFSGRSIRAGVKTEREGVDQIHPWIRSWDGGWRVSYDGESVKQRHRDLAHQAVAALGLDFGAVDLGEGPGKELIVLEVNRAPGIEGGTIEAYARAIEGWFQ